MKISNDNLIEISNLTIKGEKITSNFNNIHIKENSVYQIFGENGSGKSLLIEHIIGLRYSMNIKRRKAIKIGYFPQGYNETDKVKNIIKQFAYVSGSKYANSLKEALSIDILEERSFNSISSGEKQRVKLLLSLLIKPDLLIFDELSNGMDAQILTDVLKLIMNLKDTYRFSIIFIDHNEVVSETLKPEIIRMNTMEVNNA